jgi:hypothetical protein
MAGSISLSLSQQFDSLGKPLTGGLLQFYAAGTTNPQSAFQDVALTIPWPNPITLDGAGRVPPFYLADGQIKIRLTDKFGVLQVSADNLLVVGASSGSGAPPSVDPTTLLQTGQLVPMYGTGPITGFVRANGRTIGNASSGASERAFADTQNLFTFLYQQDTNLVVSPGGRGASAAADYAANKTIILPDWRGRALAGLDDMGNTAAGRLTSTYFGTAATVLGAAAGSENTTLALAQLPTGITATGTFNSTIGALISNPGGGISTFSTGTGGGSVWQAWTPGATINNITTPQASGTVTSNNTSGAAHRTVQPTMLATIYLKI